MNNQKKSVISLALAAGMLFTGAVISVFPSLARLSGNSPWVGYIPETHSVLNISKEDLLSEGDLIVMLGSLDGETDISFGNLDGGSIFLRETNSDWVGSEIVDHGQMLNLTEITLDNGEVWKTATLQQGDGEVILRINSLKMKTAEETSTAETTAATEETSTAETTAATEETSTAEMTAATEETSTAETTTETQSPSEPANAYRPDGVSIIVRWQKEELDKTLTFTVSAGEGVASDQNSSAGKPGLDQTLVGVRYYDENLDVYNPEIPIYLKNENDCALTLSLNDGAFPEMTRYTMNGNTHLLYSPDTIKVPAKTILAIKLPTTGWSAPTFLRISDGIEEKKFRYYTLPSVGKTTKPIVMGDVGVILSMLYSWGSATPTIKIERLEEKEGALAWIEDGSIVCEATADGELQLTPNGGTSKAKTIAGTYRAEIVWRHEFGELYRLKVPFFVFYHNGPSYDAPITEYQKIDSIP